MLARVRMSWSRGAQSSQTSVPRRGIRQRLEDFSYGISQRMSEMTEFRGSVQTSLTLHSALRRTHSTN